MKSLTRSAAASAFTVSLVLLYARLVLATNRIRIATPLPPQLREGPVLLATWHQQLAFLPWLGQPGGHPVIALSSPSRDGTFIRTIAARLGIGAVVGSSHRGAVAGLRGLLRAAQGGNTLFITPDGPRGPAFKAKPGTTQVAQLTGLPLIPCAAWCSRGITLKSWDNMRLPLPFGTIHVAYAAPLEKLTPAALGKQLNTLTQQARGAAGL